MKQQFQFLRPGLPENSISALKHEREHHYWTVHIQISLSTKFQLEIKISIFQSNFPRKGYFHSKTEKVNITIEFCIFKLVSIWNFSLKQELYFLRRNLTANSIFGLNQTSEDLYWTVHVEISLSKKFQPEIKISIFWRKLS